MKLLITAGPTREPIDAVRYISNRSSGRMGIALANAAATNEAITYVTLLAGPGVAVNELANPSVAVLRFETTADLQALLHEHCPTHDVLIMAAAVADYRPTQTHDGKLPRQSNGSLQLTLEPTPDLVAETVAMKRANQRVIAFALEEPAQLETRASEKLKRKGVDAIVANPLKTMDADTIEAIWLDAKGGRDEPGAMAKGAFAMWLIEKIATLRRSD